MHRLPVNEFKRLVYPVWRNEQCVMDSMRASLRRICEFETKSALTLPEHPRQLEIVFRLLSGLFWAY